MRKIAEIRMDLNAKAAELKELDAKDERAAALVAEVKSLADELEAAQVEERANQLLADNQLKVMEQTMKQRFSLAKFIREAASGKLSGIEAEVAEMGREEYERMGLSQQGVVIPSAALRAASGNGAGVAGYGQELVETQPSVFVESLKERLVVAKLGATIMGDLVGNVPVITSGAVSAAWGGEGAEASLDKVPFKKATMTPKRNFVAVAVSKDLIRQTSADVEAMILDKLLTAQAELIEKAAINGSGVDQPKGILAAEGVETVAMGTNGAAITWPKVVALETKINANNANRGKMGYLTNAKVYGDMKTTLKATGAASFILEGNVLNGYPVEHTNLVPSNLTKGAATTKCSAMVFGNFSDLYIGQWGGLDIVIDPYTASRKAEINLVVNSWNDVLVAEPKSFAKIVDITTAE